VQKHNLSSFTDNLYQKAVEIILISVEFYPVFIANKLKIMTQEVEKAKKMHKHAYSTSFARRKHVYML